AYPALFRKIGTKFGAGDGSTTFNLPNPTPIGLNTWAIRI
ncbi:phage tail protein, partial [Yoonia sp.]